ncbi:MAG: hypothetical protein JWM11_4116 [Planctomycetaceae bacterium]|nr:hypothetical protein [Planctomycetaceae bacterium]
MGFAAADHVLEELGTALRGDFAQAFRTAEITAELLPRAEQFWQRRLPICGVDLQSSQNVGNIAWQTDLARADEATRPIDELKIAASMQLRV